MRIFRPDSPYTKQARFIAILWTLLILVACFFPARELPHVNIPLIDKWTHVVLFGVFSFLWFCAAPTATLKRAFNLFVISVAFGAFIEVMQGILTFLGRSMELMDGVADGIGGVAGVALFSVLAKLSGKGQGY